MNNVTKNPRVLRAYLALMVAIIGWGFSAPFIEFGLAYIRPMPFLTYRFFLTVLILTPYIVLYQREAFELFKNKYVWLIGISESMGLILQYIGQQQQIPAGLTTLLILLFLLIVPFLSTYFLKESLKGQQLLAVFIGLIGIVLISSNGDIIGLISGSISVFGVLLLIGAAFGYAFYLVFTSKLQKFERPGINTFNLFYAVLAIIALISGVTTLFLDRFELPTQEGLIWLGLLILISTLLAFFAYFEAMKEIPANMASVLLLLQIIIAFSIDLLFVGRQYSYWVILGSIIILIAMVIAVLTPTENEGRLTSSSS